MMKILKKATQLFRLALVLAVGGIQLAAADPPAEDARVDRRVTS